MSYLYHETLKPLKEIFELVSKYSRRLEKNDWRKLLYLRRVVATEINESNQFTKCYALKRDTLNLILRIDSIYSDFLFYMSSYDTFPHCGENPLSEYQISELVEKLVDSYKHKYNIF